MMGMGNGETKEDNKNEVCMKVLEKVCVFAIKIEIYNLLIYIIYK